MADQVIDTGKRVFTGLKALKFTPWTDDATLGTTTYDLVNIVGDSTTVEQADNDVTTIEHEFRAEPLYESTKLGSKTVTTECIDFQNDVLKNMFGWETTEVGDAFAPIAYKDLYCKIVMEFNSTEDIVVLPKVKMNSKAAWASMKTDVSRDTINGTCYSAYVKAGNTEKLTDLAIISKTNVGTYTVSATASM